jgi:hypothetical protein
MRDSLFCLRPFWYGILSFFACIHTAVSQNELPYYRIDAVPGSTGNLTLSELAESIEYIPLETTDRCLLGSIYRFDISDNYILVRCSKARGCFLFSRKTGKFLTAIGRLGQGLGEYPSTPDNCMLDERNQYAIVISQNGTETPDMMYYNFQGKYIKSVPFNNLAFPQPPQSRTIGSGRILMMYANFSEAVPYSYEIWLDGRNRKQAIKPPKGDFPPGQYFTTEFYTYLYENRVYVKSGILNDTVYEIKNDNTFTPAYTINYGRREVAIGDLNDRVTDPMNGMSQVLPQYLFEAKDCFLLAYYLNGNRTNIYFDKRKRQTLRFNSKTGIPNDYDGGPDFFPQAQYGNLLVAFSNAFDLMGQLPKQKKIAPKGTPSAVQAFKRMYEKLEPEDNPVLIIVKIKQADAKE